VIPKERESRHLEVSPLKESSKHVKMLANTAAQKPSKNGYMILFAYS